jgi:iron-sulfur cluster repair protein YtfE (RIC family)
MSRLTDEQAAEAIAAHHVELSGEIRRRAEILAAAVRAGEPFEDARIDVLDYLDRELLPHAAAEERALYPAADRAATALLVRAMLDEHRRIVATVDRLRAATDGISAANAVSAVLALFESHLDKENDYLIPALVADPDVDLGVLLEGMHALLG